MKRRIRSGLVAASVVASASLPFGAMAWQVDVEEGKEALDAPTLSRAEIFVTDPAQERVILRSRTTRSDDFYELRLGVRVSADSVLAAVRPGDVVTLRIVSKSSR